MKKNYVAPQIEVIEIEIEGMIAASGSSTNSTTSTLERGTRGTTI